MRLRRLAVLVSMGAFFCSPCAAGPVDFPIGLYGVDKPLYLDLLKKSGFDAIQTYGANPKSVRALADEARHRGLMALLAPSEMLASGSPMSGLGNVVWYLSDEPDVHGTSPATLAALNERVKSWAPGATTALVVGDARAIGRFASCADILMVDWYPVPHLPLESLGDQVGTAVAASGGKPVWAVVQAFDWREYPQHDPKKPRIGRFPTQREMRFMSYDAVINGARGLWFFTFTRHGIGPVTKAPEQWRALADLGAEFSAMRPIFANGRQIELPFPPASLSAKAWSYRGRDFVVIVNRHKGIHVDIPSELRGPAWRPLFEPLRDVKRARLAPYDVMVFER